MGLLRRCSRTACGRPATTTLTYVYADQTAVVGPLASYAEPHAYDLCDLHSERLSAPRGWEVLRLAADRDTGPSSDDLLALADAVREAAQPRPEAVGGARPQGPGSPASPGGPGGPGGPVGRVRPVGPARQTDLAAERPVRRSARPAYDDPPGLIDRTDEPGEPTDNSTASVDGVRRGHLRSLRSVD